MISLNEQNLAEQPVIERLNRFDKNINTNINLGLVFF